MWASRGRLSHTSPIAGIDPVSETPAPGRGAHIIPSPRARTASTTVDRSPAAERRSGVGVGVGVGVGMTLTGGAVGVGMEHHGRSGGRGTRLPGGAWYGVTPRDGGGVR